MQFICIAKLFYLNNNVPWYCFGNELSVLNSLKSFKCADLIELTAKL
jgi:hypothetical protein